MIITKIQRIRGKRQRFSVHIDGVQTLEISSWTIGKFPLRTGDELNKQAIEKIKAEEADISAKNTAINFISYRQRSAKEVADHLIKKGFARACAEKVTRHLQDMKMIDDLAFAHAYVRDRLKQKPTGQILLRRQLLVKGISPAMIDSVLSELISSQNQQAAALQAVKRKMQSIRRSKVELGAEKRKKRLLDFLLRRGFPYEIALKAVHITLDR